MIALALEQKGLTPIGDTIVYAGILIPLDGSKVELQRKYEQ